MSIHTLEPGLLLAAPRLGDPNFEGTVVLLGAHEDGGSLGWTINGASVGTAAELVRATGLCTESDSLPALFDGPALRGGPVSPESVWIVYRRAPGDELLPGSLAVGDEIAVTSTVEALRTLIAGTGPAQARLLVGYAGWGPGQLHQELARGAWLPAAADPKLLFDGETSTLWQRAYAQTIGTIPAAFVSGTRGSA
jgi:putative transcriptional regulator